ncbi:MAG: hypothetical protein PWQ25_288 [Deferribacteres bacterium]|jgi:4-amino-4-deoxy-L-arabinose transferase|nr:hypothetical protein [Deferribacteraceae bacterium]MDK2791425.1 hypothetical protein [Deferribacteres bacterium]
MHNKKIYWFIAIYFVIAAFPINFIPLFETTEARYAEIAWEMVKTGDFVEPRFNGIKHFHKPPFVYWINAIGMKLFGVNGFGARFFEVLAAGLILFVTYRLSEILLKNKNKSEASVYILSSSMLFIAVSRIVSTDIYLTLFTILAQYVLFKQIYYKKATSNSIFYGIFLGLGFLTKGPIIFLFTILPFILCKFFDSSHRKVFSFKDVILSTSTFLIISLPWYIAVIIKNPELLNYFLKVQTVDRVATNRFHRYQPFYFFFAIFAGTFFPYIVPFIKGLKDSLKAFRQKISLFVYIIVPFIIFTISKSKLATYILPFYPLASIIAAEYLDANMINSRLFKSLSIIYACIFPLVLLVAPFVYVDLREYYIPIAAYLILSIILLVNIIKKFNLLNFTMFIIFSSFCIYSLLPVLGPNIKGYKKMTEQIISLDPQKKHEVLTYKSFIPSISFYRQKITVAALGKEREVQFEDNNEYKKYYIDSKKDLENFFLDHNSFFLVTNDKYINEIESYGYKCTLHFKQRKDSMYFCEKQNL